MRPYDGASYHGTPALKPAPWDWKVPLYIAIGGAAGGAQIIAGAARLSGSERSRTVVRTGRYLGIAGSIAGAPLLIYDLKTPHRWYNMLRIFRSTSPMSIGSYVLTSFGVFSGIAALGQLGSRSPQFGRIAGAAADASHGPAAITGAFMATYTAALLSGTSTPLWAASPGWLAARFGSSSIASGAAALSLGEHVVGDPANTRPLDMLSFLATAGGLTTTLLAERAYARAGVDGAEDEDSVRPWHRAALMIGYGIPLACHATNLIRRHPSRTVSAIGAVATLAGSWLMRSSVIRAGNASAQRPVDSLGFAQPERLPRASARSFLPAEQRGRARLQRMASR
jgi:formate-dependent nitrite reductase membrane component NrfD